MNQQQKQLPNALPVDFVTKQVLRLKARNCSSMASNFFKSWSLVFVLTTLTFATIIGKSLAIGYPSIPVFKPSGWVSAHATFYGDDGGVSNDMGGACGYGNMIQNGYGTTTAALSTTLFNSGYACGTCYQIKCVQSKFCYNVPYIQVTATNLCPPNWSQDSNNGGWCNPPRVHFDMSKPAFLKIAQYKAGIVPVMYRRVPCGRRGGLRFQFQGNGYWLLVYVMNVGGGGDIGNMWVKGTKTGWIAMTHNWGVSYQAFASLGGQSLSFKLASYTTKEIITVMNVSPASWSGGLTYSTNVNFH